MSGCVYLCLQVGGDCVKNFCTFHVSQGSCWGTGNRISDWEQNSWFTFCLFFIFFCLNLLNVFYFTEIVKLFGGDKIMQKVLYLQR